MFSILYRRSFTREREREDVGENVAAYRERRVGVKLEVLLKLPPWRYMRVARL